MISWTAHGLANENCKDGIYLASKCVMEYCSSYQTIIFVKKWLAAKNLDISATRQLTN